VDLPWGACLRFTYSARPDIQGKISPRIECSGLRFKCTSLLHLNRGLPGSAVYDLRTARHIGRSGGRERLCSHVNQTPRSRRGMRRFSGRRVRLHFGKRIAPRRQRGQNPVQPKAKPRQSGRCHRSECSSYCASGANEALIQERRQLFKHPLRALMASSGPPPATLNHATQNITRRILFAGIAIPPAYPPLLRSESNSCFTTGYLLQLSGDTIRCSPVFVGISTFIGL
jgi:hypothetical protein